MKKYLKKISALLVAMAMVMTMCVTALADTSVTLTTAPSNNDRGTIVVEGVEEGATVTAYRVVKAVYSTTDGAFTGYELAEGVNIADIENPTTKEIETIAKGILNKENPLVLETVNLTYSEGKYKTVDENGKASAPVGSYVILVTGTNSAAIYSPLYGSVYYSTTEDESGKTQNQITSGAINVNGSYTYAKKQDGPKPDKTIVQGETDNSKETVGLGSVVTYELSAKIPSYIDGYENLKFNFIDTLSAGLTYNDNSYIVYIDNEEDQNAEVTLTKATDTAKGTTTLTFALSKDYILVNGNKNIKIQYTATVNENAVSGVDGNKNTVILNYSNNPTSDKNSDPAEKDIYTFDITGNLLHKTDVDGKKLKDAQFALFADEGCTVRAKYANNAEIPVATSDETSGNIEFTKLNEGTYYLKEIVAPDGYQLSEKVHKIEISAVIDPTTSKLTNYTIKITDMDTDEEVFNRSFTENYSNFDITKGEGVQIKNTHLSSLPSTGSIGTYLFTLIGVVIMATTAGIFFVKRRRNAK